MRTDKEKLPGLRLSKKIRSFRARRKNQKSWLARKRQTMKAVGHKLRKWVEDGKYKQD